MAEKIQMIALSPTMEEGTIVKWQKKEGDSVSSGDVLCEVETDKATMDYESTQEGTLLKIVRGDGSSSKVGEAIGIIGEKGEDVSDLVKSIKAGSGPAAAEKAAAAEPEKEQEAPHPRRKPPHPKARTGSARQLLPNSVPQRPRRAEVLPLQHPGWSRRARLRARLQVRRGTTSGRFGEPVPKAGLSGAMWKASIPPKRHRSHRPDRPQFLRRRPAGTSTFRLPASAPSLHGDSPSPNSALPITTSNPPLRWRGSSRPGRC